MIEFEKRYLAKYLPKDFKKFLCTDIVDKYFPYDAYHPQIRLRKKDDSYTLTKKIPIDEAVTHSTQTEDTIIFTKEEFDFFNKLKGKIVEKKRFEYPYGNLKAEIDVFYGDLDGLVVVDIEVESKEQLDSFKMPGFCLVDVTEEYFIAGGLLAGKKYEDIEEELERFGYKPLQDKDLS